MILSVVAARDLSHSSHPTRKLGEIIEESAQHREIGGRLRVVSRGLQRRCMGGGKLVASGEVWHSLGPKCSAGSRRTPGFHHLRVDITGPHHMVHDQVL